MIKVKLKKELQNRFDLILERLKKERPIAECELIHRNPFELLIATILSAQCTDVRVNMVTPGLFKKFPTPEAFVRAPIQAIEKEIRTTGFYHNKAKNIKGACEKLVKDFHGKVPQTMNELLTLPGVARKTANVVLGVAFGVPSGVVVDTHVTRVSQRLGLTKETNAVKIEQVLMRLLKPEDWIYGAHVILLHGRYVCKAKKPECARCVVSDLCPSARLFLGNRYSKVGTLTRT